MSEAGPPWNTASEWVEINRSIADLIRRYQWELRQVDSLAHEVKSSLESLFAPMDRLCELTCPRCEKPCCRVANLWFDFRDLLFLHLIGRAPPESQPLKKTDDHCRFLSATGCRLPRISRPWICTWYLCPPQTAIIRTNKPHFQATIESNLHRIKKMRTLMEDEFISVIA